MRDELLREVEDRLGVTIGRQMAYEGKGGCDDPLCRRMFTADGPDWTRCMGWHCPRCHARTNMYGHDCDQEGS